MQPLSDQQSTIDHHLATAASLYPALWHNLLSQWGRPQPGDHAWLMYSANYLFHTAGVRWALDPLTLRRRLPSAPAVDISPLAALDYILLSHRHADHFDPDLLSQLANYPAIWIVPEFLLPSIQPFNLPPHKLIVPQPNQPLTLGNLTLTPFHGLHWESAPDLPQGQRGLPALGYLAEFSGKRWLIPGDTRTYDPTSLPPFGPLTGLIAHLWLGRKSALYEEPPLLDAFCNFCLHFSPLQIVLTHLEELGRAAPDYWDRHHAQKVIARLHTLAPATPASSARMGDTIPLY